MRYLLIFDTETTGLLPKYFMNNEKNINQKLNELPYIVQFSFILFDTKTMKVLESVDHIIKIPENVVISPDSIEVHGITKDMTKNGTEITDVLDKFHRIYEKCDLLIAHNLQFDCNILKIELLRNNREYNGFESKPMYCTMQNSVKLCDLKAINSLGIYTKFPKLDELHFQLFHEKPKNLHNSYYDIVVCIRCFLKLTKDIDLFHYNKQLESFYRDNIQ